MGWSFFMHMKNESGDTPTHMSKALFIICGFLGATRTMSRQTICTISLVVLDRMTEMCYFCHTYFDNFMVIVMLELSSVP